MAAMPTQTGIINRAAALLGATARIASIDDGSNLASHAKEHWGPALRLLLADHPWNFALKRMELNMAAAAPVSGWDAAFTLPADCLRWFPPSRDESEWFEGVQEGDAILCNEAAPLPVRFVSHELGQNLTRWPPHFEEAMTMAMAASLAEPITQSETIAQRFAERAEGALIRAKRKDGLSSGSGKRRVNVDRRSRWLGSRRSAYSFSGY